MAVSKRRIIVDNDGGDIFYCAGPSYEQFTASRFAGLAGTGANTVFYTTVSSGFGVFSHDTRIGHVRTEREQRHPRNIAGELIAGGTDCLRYAVRFCREHDMDIYWGMRMNDTHDGTGASYSDFSFNHNPWKLSHPQCLMGTKDKKPKYGAWSAVNYGCEAVRDLAFLFAEEVCRNYDIDGIHLDFFRHPVFFPSVAGGQPATEQELGQMTALMRRIRRMTGEQGDRRGKPIGLSVRVPDSVEYCRLLGLDIETWLSEGLVSLLCTSSYLQLNDWEYSVELGRRYGVPVCPSLDETRIGEPEANGLRTAPEGMRARCMNVWSAGADGVLLFNYIFDDVKGGGERYGVIRDIADPGRLAGLPKTYFASFRGVGAVAGSAPPHGGYIRIPVLNPGAPLHITGSGETTLYVGEDCASKQEAELWLWFEAEGPRCGVCINGAPAGSVDPQGGRAVLAVRPVLFRRGRNRIAFAADGRLRLMDLCLAVR